MGNLKCIFTFGACLWAPDILQSCRQSWWHRKSLDDFSSRSRSAFWSARSTWSSCPPVRMKILFMVPKEFCILMMVRIKSRMISFWRHGCQHSSVEKVGDEILGSRWKAVKEEPCASRGCRWRRQTRTAPRCHSSPHRSWSDQWHEDWLLNNDENRSHAFQFLYHYWWGPCCQSSLLIDPCFFLRGCLSLSVIGLTMPPSRFNTCSQ